MKRRGWVTEEIAEMDNLRLAFWKAKRGKNAQKEVVDFAFPSLDENLMKLSRQILSGQVETGNYHIFKIYDPKERIICAAPFKQRVLHHAIMNVCHNDFDRKQIYDSYASRLGKGTYAALNRATGFHKKFRYCLKMDVRKFFDSIDHDILLWQLEKMFKDARLLGIFGNIISSYNTAEGKGLPIGNLTSQYFANHYLSVIDHKSKEDFKASAYLRYMDDILIYDNSRDRLLDIGRTVNEYMEKNLKLELKEMQIKSTRQYTTYLGYKLSSDRIKLSKRSADRYKKHIKSLFYEYNIGNISQEEMNQRLCTVLAFVEKVESSGLKRQVMQRCV